ncbi:MAG: hypothetical protein ACO4AI_09545, partial [Prochlorothrix sp.]
DGALRDAESLLDQGGSFSDSVSAQTVSDVLGLVDRTVFFDAARAIAANASAPLSLGRSEAGVPDTCSNNPITATPQDCKRLNL